MSTEIWTVTQVTRYIKDLLESAPGLGELWIAGELSNWSRASSGHCYFTLKDAAAEMPCVMWRSAATRLAFEPRVGDWVQGLGSVSVYERGGKYQFYVTFLQRAGVGALWESFLALKESLEREGLFDASRKRPLPTWPRCIGVVTSPTGAALRDILNVLSERYPPVEVLLSPSTVQGAEAPTSLVRALRRLYARPDVDVIIVARGGGSLEDLWSFNDESLARTITEAPVAVVTGVGHETDFTIADLVADYRAPTPSAAAAAVVPDAATLLDAIARKHERSLALVEAKLDQSRLELERAQRRLRLQAPQRRVNELWQQLDDATRTLGRVAAHTMGAMRYRLESQSARLAALNPTLILKRGYAVVQDAETGRTLTRAQHASRGQLVDLCMYKGHLRAQIREIMPDAEAEGGEGDGS